MPRKRKQTETPVEAGDDQHESVGTTATMVAEPPAKSPKRRRRAKATEAEVVPSDVQSESVEMTTAAMVEPPAAVSAPTGTIEEPPFEPTGKYTPGETPPETASAVDGKPRGQFRSWVADTARGYSRLTDEQHQRIVVQFDAKPPADVLTALKGAGFQFQPDYQGQKNAWVRQNNYEGRLQIEAIEVLLRETVQGSPSPSR